MSVCVRVIACVCLSSVCSMVFLIGLITCLWTVHFGLCYYSISSVCSLSNFRLAKKKIFGYISTVGCNIKTVVSNQIRY